MTRFLANVGDASALRPRKFAEFVLDAIERAESIKSVAVRWGIPEESLRRYRDGQQSPAFERLCEFQLDAAERLQLCRILGASMISVEPLNADEADRRRQSAMVGVTEQELRGTSHSLAHAAQEVVEVIHESLADGQIDASERQRMEQAVDQVQKTAGRLRPGFWQRLRNASAVRNLFGRG